MVSDGRLTSSSSVPNNLPVVGKSGFSLPQPPGMSKTVLALLSPLFSGGCFASVVGVSWSGVAKLFFFPSKRFWVSLAHSVEGVPRGRVGGRLLVVDISSEREVMGDGELLDVGWLVSISMVLSRWQ